MARVVVSLGLGLLLMSSPVLSAEKFPDRPINLIVNYGAGGSTDVAIRLLAKVAEKKLGVPIVIANKAGGGGLLGITEVSKSKPDGYTIGTLTIAAMSAVPYLQKVAYDPFKDFDYICGFGRYLYGVYVKADSPFRSIKGVVEEARKNPGKVTYGSMSLGIALGMKYVETKENVKMTYIPLQSGQETATALLGGHVQLAIGTAIYQFIETKEIRAIAAITEERMPPPLQDVPTMRELGYDIDITGWMGLGAPAGVPKERLDLLYGAFKAGSNDPEVKATLEKLLLSAPYISGDEMKKIFVRRAAEWKPLLESVKSEQTKK